VGIIDRTNETNPYDLKCVCVCSGGGAPTKLLHHYPLFEINLHISLTHEFYQDIELFKTV